MGVGVEQDRAIEGRLREIAHLDQVMVLGGEDLDPIEAIGLDRSVGDDRKRNPGPYRLDRARRQHGLGATNGAACEVEDAAAGIGGHAASSRIGQSGRLSGENARRRSEERADHMLPGYHRAWTPRNTGQAR